MCTRRPYSISYRRRQVLAVTSCQSLYGLCDVTLTRGVGNAEIAGLDIDGRMCGQLTELK